jgi:hypothetical protein
MSDAFRQRVQPKKNNTKHNDREHQNHGHDDHENIGLPGGRDKHRHVMSSSRMKRLSHSASRLNSRQSSAAA